MLAAILGAGPVADAFFVALRLPNHFRAIFAEGGWFKGTVIAMPFICLVLDISSWYFTKLYHPFAWRDWKDFGTGALGDMACHTVNMPFRSLNLGYPTEIEGTPLSAMVEAWHSGNGALS